MFNKKFIKLDKKIESKEDLFKYIARKLYQYNRIDNEDNFINAWQIIYFIEVKNGKNETLWTIS